jgi:hypothetical protein
MTEDEWRERTGRDIGSNGDGDADDSHYYDGDDFAAAVFRETPYHDWGPSSPGSPGSPGGLYQAASRLSLQEGQAPRDIQLDLSYMGADTDKLSLAWATTVHKAQVRCRGRGRSLAAAPGSQDPQECCRVQCSGSGGVGL